MYGKVCICGIKICMLWCIKVCTVYVYQGMNGKVYVRYSCTKVCMVRYVSWYQGTYGMCVSEYVCTVCVYQSMYVRLCTKVYGRPHAPPSPVQKNSANKHTSATSPQPHHCSKTLKNGRIGRFVFLHVCKKSRQKNLVGGSNLIPLIVLLANLGTETELKFQQMCSNVVSFFLPCVPCVSTSHLQAFSATLFQIRHFCMTIILLVCRSRGQSLQV
jgi:hypothetical protein